MVSIPVTRSGSVQGLQGRAWSNEEHWRARYQDTFAVLDGLHFRSTAEVRSTPVQVRAIVVAPDQDLQPQTFTTVAATTSIVPGERITALDMPLPGSGWTLVHSNVLAGQVSTIRPGVRSPKSTGKHGIRCNIREPDTSSPYLRCIPINLIGNTLPTGRYQLAFGFVRPGEPNSLPTTQGEVSLTTAGRPHVVDTFVWVTFWEW